MSRIKKVILALVILFIAVQFIQPARNNNNGQVLSTDIARIVSVPDGILDIFKNSCYDCHSNYTRYPWYSCIQPGGWWMASHIKNGKENLNFSQFGNYSKRMQRNKLREMARSIDDESMPIPAYAIIHKNAKLTKTQKTSVLDWINKTKESLSQPN
ncbi:MAG: heme-binding domain-containing protein [Chitinophagales bacterium]|nr:heme-binding domain-containing protein [Chitinophagales bacterium]